MKSKNGFTLVELLAVIVILAIIVVLVTPNILNSMESAKQNALAVEAQRAANAALQAYSAELAGGVETAKKGKATVLSDGNYLCYTLAQLDVDSSGKYSGIVFYGPIGSDSATAYVAMTDKEYVTGTDSSNKANNLFNTTYGTTAAKRKTKPASYFAAASPIEGANVFKQAVTAAQITSYFKCL